MSDEAAIDWFKRDNEALRAALAASQEREARLRDSVAEYTAQLKRGSVVPPTSCTDTGGIVSAATLKAVSDRLESILSEALSTPSDAGRGGWLPIETAPKDGKFMVLADHGLPWPAYRNGDQIISNAHGPVNNPNDKFSLKATHWMPLPQPPPASGEESLG